MSTDKANCTYAFQCQRYILANHKSPPHGDIYRVSAILTIWAEITPKEYYEKECNNAI